MKGARGDVLLSFEFFLLRRCSEHYEKIMKISLYTLGKCFHNNGQMSNTTKEKTFKWVVEFTVTESWVADGFDLTDERAMDMLQGDLQYAYSHELAAKVLKAPLRTKILKAQGYKV